MKRRDLPMNTQGIPDACKLSMVRRLQLRVSANPRLFRRGFRPVNAVVFATFSAIPICAGCEIEKPVWLSWFVAMRKPWQGPPDHL